MKTLFYLSLFLLSICSCDLNSHSEENHQKVLGGNHELRKFNVRSKTTHYTHEYFFLVVGGYGSEDITDTKVRFYFKNHFGAYQFMERDFEDVTIKTDSTITTPYIRFYWSKSDRDLDEWRQMYDYDVTGIVIHCHERDFQPEININDLK